MFRAWNHLQRRTSDGHFSHPVYYVRYASLYCGRKTMVIRYVSFVAIGYRRRSFTNSLQPRLVVANFCNGAGTITVFNRLIISRAIAHFLHFMQMGLLSSLSLLLPCNFATCTYWILPMQKPQLFPHAGGIKWLRGNTVEASSGLFNVLYENCTSSFAYTRCPNVLNQTQFWFSSDRTKTLRVGILRSIWFWNKKETYI